MIDDLNIIDLNDFSFFIDGKYDPEVFLYNIDIYEFDLGTEPNAVIQNRIYSDGCLNKKHIPLRDKMVNGCEICFMRWGDDMYKCEFSTTLSPFRVLESKVKTHINGDEETLYIVENTGHSRFYVFSDKEWVGSCGIDTWSSAVFTVANNRTFDRNIKTIDYSGGNPTIVLHDGRSFASKAIYESWEGR